MSVMKIKVGVGLAAFLGLFLAVALVAYHGFGAVGEAIATAGLWGLLAVSLFHLVPVIFSALGWRSLFKGPSRGSLARFMWLRLVREAVSNLLPVAQIGGEVVAARMLTFYGVRPGTAGGSVVVDLTIEVVTQFLFTLVGVGLLVLGRYDAEFTQWLLVGLAIMAPALLGFVIAQRRGMFKLVERFFERLAEKWAWAALGRLSGLDATIRALYRDRRAIISGGLCHMVSWTLGTGEIWLALHFMGSPVSLSEAMILESLGQAVRSAAFIVPAGLGVQEGGFLLLGAMLGLTPDVALALSLIKRVRDVFLGVPALASWHVLEGRRLLARADSDPKEQADGT